MKELIRQALARGYCSKRNEHKVLDPDLIEDMAVEVEKVLTEKPEKVFTTTDQARKSLRDVKFLDNNEVFRKPKAEKSVEKEWCECGTVYGEMRCLPQDIHRVFCKLCKREIRPTEIKPKNPPKIERLKGDWVTTDQKIDKMENKINDMVDWIDRHNDLE